MSAGNPCGMGVLAHVDTLKMGLRGGMLGDKNGPSRERYERLDRGLTNAVRSVS